MYAMLSLLSGGVLVILVYGLSFCPSATLSQLDDEETISQAGQDGGNPNTDIS